MFWKTTSAAFILLILAVTVVPAGAGAETDYALSKAAGAGKVTRVKALLDAGADPNADVGGGTYSLGEASRGGHKEVVDVLLSRGAYVGVGAGAELNFALAEAARRGDVERVKALLSAGADPDADVGEGTFALAEAARGGHKKVVDVLLASGAVRGIGSGAELNFALSVAAAHGKTERVKSLLAAGADPNADVGGGTYSLAEAEKGGHTATARLLEKNGAHLGKGRGVELDYALIIAAADGKLERMEALIEAGANVNAQNSEGVTCLMVATQAGKSEAVKLLLSKGAIPAPTLGQRADSTHTNADQSS